MSDIRDILHTEIYWSPHGLPLETGLDRQSALLLPLRTDGHHRALSRSADRDGQAPYSPHPRRTRPGLERCENGEESRLGFEGGDKFPEKPQTCHPGRMPGPEPGGDPGPIRPVLAGSRRGVDTEPALVQIPRLWVPALQPACAGYPAGITA